MRMRSYLNLWTIAYFVVMCLLTSLTTSSALYLLLDDKGNPRISLVPNSFLPLLAAVVGVFGFEFLVRKFVIGFGENQWDLNTSLDDLAAHAVSATLLKEAE